MKQFCKWWLCVFVVFGIVSGVASAQEEWMPDPNLRQAVSEKLNLPQNIPLTVLHLERLRDLVILESNIADLQGLEHAVNLHFLHLSNSRVSDLTPLAELLSLETLKLYSNNISDITPLSNLTALKHLELHDNQITDLTSLTHLTNLEELSITGNPITDFSSLAEFPHFAHLIPIVIEIPDPTLERVIRGKLGLSAKIPLTDVEMHRLWDLVVLESDITNLQGLEHAINLRFLHLSSSQIVDLTPIANLVSLEVLKLYDNKVSDITPLANLTNLQELNLSGNQIMDVAPLANLVNLKALLLGDNPIIDYSSISKLSGVNFGYCEIPRFSTIDRIKNRNYPSIFSAWHNIINLPTLSYSERLAHHDLHFCCPLFGLDFAETEQGVKLVGDLKAARNQRDAILEQNPNMLFLVGIYYYGAHPDTFPENWPYWLRDENGNRVQDVGWSELLIDFTIPEAQDFFVQQAVAAAECGLYDGIFFDWWSEEWNALYNRGTGERYYDLEVEVNAKISILRRIREAVGDDFLILVNTNRSKVPRSAQYVNGTFMETLRDHKGGYTYVGLSEIESTLLWSEENFQYPQINSLEGWGIETEPLDSFVNRRWMRLFTTLSLTHSDGYVQYVSGISSTRHTHAYEIWKGHSAEHAGGEIHDHQHHHYYYNFWDAELGQPIGEKGQPYENREGVFIREFTNGWAVYNRSGKAQEIRLPEQATGVESGLRNTVHSVPDLDGEIYLKRVADIHDINGDGTVNILDLVVVANGFGTDAPDVNGDRVVNILDLVAVANAFGQ
ncbi:leucine-rich repeat domain-containing protein [Candidatus Poribacteria bacterium]|nr:leucine-rich repeat domain-containing protein [Candidatus Poribacteria bacterium]